MNRPKDPEIDPSSAHDAVWTSIGGALKAAQLYIGDRLDLYSTLRDACSEPKSSVTAEELADMTGYHARWLGEWLAQQASMGILVLLPGNKENEEELRYRIPRATADVLANPDSPEYDVSLIMCIPSLVHRAKTMLPEAFLTGIGRPYDEPEVAQGIDRHHRIEIRDILLPQILPRVKNGAVHKALQDGCKVADLGCGAGNLVLAMARQYPNSTIDGYEVSQQALSIGATELVKSQVKNAFLMDANEDSLGSHENEYDVIMTFDVLHDAPDPKELIRQARAALKPDGVWILGDVAGKASVRENVTKNAGAGMQLAFSTCLCMACSLSTKDGAGLGTLGFSVPVAEKMLKEGGFQSVRVIMETKKNTRWFEVM
jgi:precorrin-6B methylase 2